MAKILQEVDFDDVLKQHLIELGGPNSAAAYQNEIEEWAWSLINTLSYEKTADVLLAMIERSNSETKSIVIESIRDSEELKAAL